MQFLDKNNLKYLIINNLRVEIKINIYLLLSNHKKI